VTSQESKSTIQERENTEVVKRLWRALDASDFSGAGAVLHDDYVGEYPQTGEKIVGRDNYVALNQNYPGRWKVKIRRIIARGDEVVSEVSLHHRGQAVFAVSFFEIREGKILREWDYWAEPYEPPPGREQWIERA
jgi:ketosteroid isomerase-like protein